ncbi:MAG: hypothetical protein J6P07_06750 [Spirochaetaceae bacterium]|nr:hypothetical protein [Spirochaetaceae bacterium]MBO7731520.1 hypothetical protein [Methanobrevibacter sp.]
MLISRYDAKLSFGSATPTSADTYPLSNVIDLGKGQAGRKVVNFIVETTFAGGTNATLVVQGSADNSVWATVESSPAIATASLVKDANFTVAIPQDFDKKYLRVAAITTGTHTAGKISATLDVYEGA